MKLWSRGLGKTEVYMDFRHYNTVKSPDGSVLIVGKMQSPVTWEFVVTMQPEDIAGIMKSMFTVPMLTFIFKNLFQYFIYLFNRKKYTGRDETSAEKIFSSYAQVLRKEERAAV